MFSSEKNKRNSMPESLSMEINRISKKTTFKGNIESQGDFRIDGTIEGDLITNGKVIIGSKGKVLGKIKCINADIEGVFEGYLEVKSSLYLKPTSNVSGDVYMESLTVEPGAVFNANCRMINSIKNLNKTNFNGSTEKKQLKNISKVS